MLSPAKIPLFFVLLINLIVRCSAQNNTADSLISVLGKTTSDTSRINLLNQIAKQLRNKETLKSLEYAKEAYKLAEQAGYESGKATAADLIGVVYLNFGEYETALRHHFIALGIFEKLNDQRGIAFTCNNIGAVHSHLKNYEKAESYYLKSLTIKLKTGLNKEASSSYVNLGNIKMYQKKLDECIRYYNLGLANARKYNDKTNITISYMNLGEAYIDGKKPGIALTYYNKAIPYILESGNKHHESQTYFAIGKIYTDLGEYEEAEMYFKRSLEISKIAKVKPLELNIYKYISRLYEKQNRPAEALEYNKLYIALNDSLYSQESTKITTEMQARYEAERKDKQIELLNKDKTIAEGNLSKERLVRYFLIAGFILILIVLTVLLRNIYLKQKVNRVLQEKNREIQNQQLEIELKNQQLTSFNKELMKENISAKYEILKSKINPHFLFNSLSALSGLIIKDRDAAHTYVSRFAKMYRSILELENHKLIGIDEEMRFVQEYVALQNVRLRDNIRLICKISVENSNILIPPFAMQLLIENAIKHNEISDERQLEIVIYFEEPFLVVKNNINQREALEPSTGIGQKNIRDRYRLVSSIEPRFESNDQFYFAYLPILIRANKS